MSKRKGMRTYGGMLGPYRQSDFENAALGRQAKKIASDFLRYLRDQPVFCRGCCKMILPTDIYYHEEYGCTVATAIGRGSIAT